MTGLRSTRRRCRPANRFCDRLTDKFTEQLALTESRSIETPPNRPLTTAPTMTPQGALVAGRLP
jgi:hypothetical protein